MSYFSAEALPGYERNASAPAAGSGGQQGVLLQRPAPVEVLQHAITDRAKFGEFWSLLQSSTYLTECELWDIHKYLQLWFIHRHYKLLFTFLAEAHLFIRSNPNITKYFKCLICNMVPSFMCVLAVEWTSTHEAFCPKDVDDLKQLFALLISSIDHVDIEDRCEECNEGFERRIPQERCIEPDDEGCNEQECIEPDDEECNEQECIESDDEECNEPDDEECNESDDEECNESDDEECNESDDEERYEVFERRIPQERRIEPGEYVKLLKDIIYSTDWQKAKNVLTIIYKLGIVKIITHEHIKHFLEHIMLDLTEDRCSDILLYILILFYKTPPILVESGVCEYFGQHKTQKRCFEYFDLNDSLFENFLLYCQSRDVDCKFFKGLMEYFFYKNDTTDCMWKRAMTAQNFQLLEFAWNYFIQVEYPQNIILCCNDNLQDQVLWAISTKKPVWIVKDALEHINKYGFQQMMDELVDVLRDSTYDDVVQTRLRQLQLHEWFKDRRRISNEGIPYPNLMGHPDWERV